MLLYQILEFTTHLKSMKSLYKNNKFETSNPTWNDKCKLPEGSRSVSDIQDYIEYI